MQSSRGPIETRNPLQKPWEARNKLVVGIDIGTTQSGVAIAFFETGQLPRIYRVTKWPGQESLGEQGKIPTVVWYDTDKKAVAFGAEALAPHTEEQAEDHGWTLAKHFKLHLHPDDMKAKHNLKLDNLPPGVSLRQIYADFLGYLHKHTRAYFEDRMVDGALIWEQCKPTMEIIIAHPNGWGVREQTFLRGVAIDSGLVDSSLAPSKVRFVTEAEASVHFCIYQSNLGTRLQPGTIFGVCDAGGSTVDTTVYSVAGLRPMLKLQEKCASACVQAGAIFVDAAAEYYLHNTLSGAGLRRLDVEDYTKAGSRDFERHAKRTFADETKEYSIAIARSRFSNPKINVHRGHMKLPGSVVQSFFDLCVKEILASVDEQLGKLDVSHILLVGGFGDSPLLRNEFKKRYEPRGCQITLANDSASKAVADGAVIWNTISSVVSRAPRSSFGISNAVRYSSPVHAPQGRVPFVRRDGGQWVHGAWSPIVLKASPSHARYTVGRTGGLSPQVFQILQYAQPEIESLRGGLVSGFRQVCRLVGNLSDLSKALQRRDGEYGEDYWKIVFEVCIRFGGTELEAYLEWKEEVSGHVRQ
ncbi:Heat shock protein HSP70 [Ceratobasidium theobromae]|uniref:Heat shock protein HSP70 n=1 Tax=Ceratobasidium theobromae TaxID=1582974 RepID=A0A5N5QN26_9AGAM|nr:Heat shock protein HSP70 [Ceratobasidium theobromae]